MESYIKGLISGGVFVFTFMVLMIAPLTLFGTYLQCRLK